MGVVFQETKNDAESCVYVWHQLFVEYSEQYSEQCRVQFSGQ